MNGLEISLPAWTIYILAVIATVLVFFIAFTIVSWIIDLRCPKCRFRIASVKFNSRHSSFYASKAVCSSCVREIQNEETGLTVQGTWWIGASVEYLKNTPNFIAIWIAIGALVVSIVGIAL